MKVQTQSLNVLHAGSYTDGVNKSEHVQTVLQFEYEYEYLVFDSVRFD